ncbi:MAG: histidinol dehydrogenase [Prevotellaceae bacterium]|nr:histidinol dehydrogenase [Candidatus Faecinaster equi]
MKIIKNPSRDLWNELLKRPAQDVTKLFSTVQGIIDEVVKNGDKALIEYAKIFDKVELKKLAVTPEEIEEAEKGLDTKLKQSIELAYQNIAKFHKAQVFAPIKVETSKGVVCEQRAVAIEKVGLYVPGGTAPLFSTVLMLAAPAKIAGCKQIILCSPPDKKGKINAAILYAAKICGVTDIYKVGGSQAIAAMAFGTESINKVDKIYGPGNQYVMAAKQLVSLGDVAIDMPAGPSEVEVLADDSCNPAFVAADLLSQAEHGADSQAVLITNSEIVAEEVAKQVEIQLKKLKRQELIEKSLSHSLCFVMENMDEAIELTNEYAPEHLVIATKDYHKVCDKIIHAGSIFLGNYSCESAGDYASGTNHTLPTKGYAKAYSGLCLDSFTRKMTIQELSAEGIKSIGETVATMASGEMLDAHENAMRIRMKK